MTPDRQEELVLAIKVYNRLGPKPCTCNELCDVLQYEIEEVLGDCQAIFMKYDYTHCYDR